MHRQGRYDDALRVLETVRGRLEAEALQHHSSQPLHAPTTQEQELTRLNLDLINTDDPKKRDALMSAIYQTEISLGPSKLAAVSIAHPVPLPQLQRVLSQDQLLIEYVLANPTSYAQDRGFMHIRSLQGPRLRPTRQNTVTRSIPN
jgi:hypothetical protein